MASTGWKLARTRRSVAAQLPLAICLALALGILLLGRAEASIFDNARAKFTDGTAPALNAARGPVVVVQRWLAGLGDVLSVYEENLALRAENEALRRWQDVALTLEERVERYQALLNAVPDPNLPRITARVIGHSSRPFTKTLILNAGANQQVRKGQAVVGERGLLGRIYLTGETSSWVLPITDLNSRIPVIIRPSNRRAILSGNNTLAPHLRLDSGEVQISEGDRIYTTGDGGILPPELPVGVVLSDGDDWRAALYTNPDLSDLVQIVDYVPEFDPPADEGLPVSVLPPLADAPSGAETAAETPSEGVSVDDPALSGEVVSQ